MQCRIAYIFSLQSTATISGWCKALRRGPRDPEPVLVFPLHRVVCMLLSVQAFLLWWRKTCAFSPLIRFYTLQRVAQVLDFAMCFRQVASRRGSGLVFVRVGELAVCAHTVSSGTARKPAVLFSQR